MKKSQLLQDVQDRLSSLLKDPIFAKARQDRALLSKGFIEDVLFTFNTSVSEEILNLDESSVKGTVKDKNINAFRKHITGYMEKNGTGYEGYDNYVIIISEYLALVAQKPLHPPEVRHLKDDPPNDTDHRRYCAWRTRYIKDRFSLCRFCNCLPWPEAKETLSKNLTGHH